MEPVNVTWMADDFGPASMTVLKLPSGCRGMVAIDDTSLGPAAGGVRMSSEVTASDVSRLARAMTLKNAISGLPFGGGKAGILVPQDFPAERKEPVIRAFACAIRDLRDYIPGPDMGTDETAMAWIHDETGRAVGLPAVLGGLALDEIGATGYGLAACAQALAAAGKFDLAGARVAVQGFGSVGRAAACFLQGLGARVVAVSDRSGAITDPAGLDVNALALAKKQGRPLAMTPDAQHISGDELLTLTCEVLVPAAQPDVIHDGNADRVLAKVVLPGANIAVTESAELTLHKRGILCMPDFLANAGGVICAWAEYRGSDKTQALSTIDGRIRANSAELLDRMRLSDGTPRHAANAMAWQRLAAARELKRKF
ncbi:Glu/Leu/Phe/Val family dehydrogenase [Catelliglobosispora koreensis]|uniref:Glu/Leu/Phe/Val family dehydrogenase n=1 Tax=Catelliglobosispora koreensis TaxID=129052 RepID=UPI00036051E7|nr:Glu/Leu/Phe/Val dehydrogenase [Catelliglobosispora koreensis]